MSPARAQAQFRPEKGAAARRLGVLDAAAGGWQARARAIGLAALRTALAMAVSVALCLGAVRGWEWARTSPFFAVRSISVRGALHAKQGDLVSRSGLGGGQNLFRVDLALAARGVESSPWVTSAQVSRRFPMAIEIEVTEHAPVAKIVLGGSSSYLVDTHGAVFKKVAEEDGELDLPLVTGIGRAEWDTARAAAQQKILVAIGFAEAWREEGLRPEQLEEIQLDAAGAITAQALDGPAAGPATAQEIVVGQGPFGPKLKKLARIREALGRRREQASRIDLDNRLRPDTVAATVKPIATTSDKATPRGAARSQAGE
jgi:cell division protein FtsQ